MKTFSKITLLLLFSIILISCGEKEVFKQYRFADDGLIYFNNSDKLFSGTIIDTSLMIIQYDVVDGKKNGSFLVFFPDGKLAQSGYLIDNKNEGEWRYYHQNGNIESRGVFVDDKPEGEWEFFYPNGILKSKGKFEKGVRAKDWYDFYENGNIRNIYYFDDGELYYTFFKMS